MRERVCMWMVTMGDRIKLKWIWKMKWANEFYLAHHLSLSSESIPMMMKHSFSHPCYSSMRSDIFSWADNWIAMFDAWNEWNLDEVNRIANYTVFWWCERFDKDVLIPNGQKWCGEELAKVVCVDQGKFNWNGSNEWNGAQDQISEVGSLRVVIAKIDLSCL